MKLSKKYITRIVDIILLDIVRIQMLRHPVEQTFIIYKFVSFPIKKTTLYFLFPQIYLRLQKVITI